MTEPWAAGPEGGGDSDVGPLDRAAGESEQGAVSVVVTVAEPTSSMKGGVEGAERVRDGVGVPGDWPAAARSPNRTRGVAPRA